MKITKEEQLKEIREYKIIGERVGDQNSRHHGTSTMLKILHRISTKAADQAQGVTMRQEEKEEDFQRFKSWSKRGRGSQLGPRGRRRVVAYDWWGHWRWGRATMSRGCWGRDGRQRKRRQGTRRGGRGRGVGRRQSRGVRREWAAASGRRCGMQKMDKVEGV